MGGLRLNDGCMSSSTQATSWLDALSGYPEWLVAAVLTIVAVVAIWLVAKLLKWSLYLLMVMVLVGGVIATIWLLFA